jgi:hypothetical protein
MSTVLFRNYISFKVRISNLPLNVEIFLVESVKNEIDMVCCPFLHILPRRESIWLLAKTVTIPIP